MPQESARETDAVRGLTRVLAEDLDESPEEIERQAAEFDLQPPWDAERESTDG